MQTRNKTVVLSKCKVSVVRVTIERSIVEVGRQRPVEVGYNTVKGLWGYSADRPTDYVFLKVSATNILLDQDAVDVTRIISSALFSWI